MGLAYGDTHASMVIGSAQDLNYGTMLVTRVKTTSAGSRVAPALPWTGFNRHSLCDEDARDT